MPTRGSAVGLRFCVAAVQPQSCRTTFPPRGAETPPPLTGVPFEAAVRRSALSRILLRPAAAGTRTARACPGPESCRKLRRPTLSIEHFRGSLFSRKTGGLGAPGPLPLVSSLWWHVTMAPFSFSLRQHPLPPERRPGPLQSKHTSSQRPCSSPWPWKVVSAEAGPFGDRCIEAFDA